MIFVFYLSFWDHFTLFYQLFLSSFYIFTHQNLASGWWIQEFVKQLALEKRGSALSLAADTISDCSIIIITEFCSFKVKPEAPWKLKRFKSCDIQLRCIPIIPSLRKQGPMALSECLVDLRNSFLFRLSCRVQNLRRIYGEGQHLWWLHVRIIIFQVVVKTMHTLTICKQWLFSFFISLSFHTYVRIYIWCICYSYMSLSKYDIWYNNRTRFVSIYPNQYQSLECDFFILRVPPPHRVEINPAHSHHREAIGQREFYISENQNLWSKRILYIVRIK